MAHSADRNIWEVVKARSSIDYELSETKSETSMEDKEKKKSLKASQDEHGTSPKQKTEHNGYDDSDECNIVLNGGNHVSPESPIIKTEVPFNGYDGDNNCKSLFAVFTRGFSKSGRGDLDCLDTDTKSSESRENGKEERERETIEGDLQFAKKNGSHSATILERSPTPELSYTAPLKHRDISTNNCKENSSEKYAKELEENASETGCASNAHYLASTAHTSVTENVIIQSIVTRPTFDVTTQLQSTIGPDSAGHVVYAHGMATPLTASSETHVIHSANNQNQRNDSFPFTERLKKLSKLAVVRTEPEMSVSTVLNGSKTENHVTPCLSRSPDVKTCRAVEAPAPQQLSETCTHSPTSQIPVAYDGTSVTPSSTSIQSAPCKSAAMPKIVSTVSMVTSENVSLPSKSLREKRSECFGQTDSKRRQGYSSPLNTNVPHSGTQFVTQTVQHEVTQYSRGETVSSKVIVSNNRNKLELQNPVVTPAVRVTSSENTNNLSANVAFNPKGPFLCPPQHFRLYPIIVNNQNNADTLKPVKPLTIRHQVPTGGFYAYSKSDFIPTCSVPAARVYRYQPSISNFTAFRPVRRPPGCNELFPVPSNVRFQWDKKSGRDLSCRERLQPSPELRTSETRFRPVSPNLKYNTPSAMISKDSVQRHVKHEFSAPDMIQLRLSQRSQSSEVEVDRRSSIEKEIDVTGQSYSFECALNDSCESPLASVLQSRCDSPIPFGYSPKSRSSNSSCISSTNKSIDSDDSKDSKEKSETDSVSDSGEKDLENNSSVNCESIDSNSNREQKKRRSSMNVISKRLEPRLPSPVKDRGDVDLFRDPRELTREERALQRAMLMFCEMEMKEKVKAENQKKRTRRQLRRRSKLKTRESLSRQGRSKSNEFKAKQKNWVSEQIKLRTKSTVEEEPPSLERKSKSGDVKTPLAENAVKPVQPAKPEDMIPAEKHEDTKPVRPAKLEKKTSTKDGTTAKIAVLKRKRSVSLDGDHEMRKKRRFSLVKQQCLHENARERNDTKQPSMNTKTVKKRRQSDDTRRKLVNSHQKGDGVEKPHVPNITATKKKRSLEDRRRIMSVKRARLHKQQQECRPKVMFCDINNHITQEKRIMTEQEKAERSHRVKTYMLVASYSGFKDFKPVVLESRTRGKSKPGDTAALLEGKQPVTSSASTEKFSNKSDFPLLVVEEVHSKPVKETLIAEDERVCSIWKESLKAQGKWRGDDLEKLNEEEFLDEESLKAAKKLSVNRNTGETILHKAARLGYQDTVRRYIHEGADPSAKDNAGWTPLHEACARGKLGVVKVLTRYGADVNVCSNDGIRPIHDAAEGCQIDVLRILLSYGADPLLATYAGNTALMCAKEPNTRKFLKGYLGDVMLQDLSNEFPSDDEDCWEFAGSSSIFNAESKPENISGIFDGVPDCRDIGEPEFEASENPHLPTYNLPFVKNGVVVGRRNYMLIQEILERLGWARTTLFKRCKNKLEIREMPWSEFLEEISHNQFCVKPKHAPAGSSLEEPIAELVPVTYSLRSILGIRTETVKR